MKRAVQPASLVGIRALAEYVARPEFDLDGLPGEAQAVLTTIVAAIDRISAA
jgi:hypothetical protein